MKQNASGYTARQSHAAVWPCCGTTQALPGLTAGVDLGLYTAQHEIPQSRDWKYPRERVRQRERERKGGGGTTAGEEMKSEEKAERDERGIWKIHWCPLSTSFSVPAALNTCI